jgi:nicotinamidase-related amidase
MGLERTKPSTTAVVVVDVQEKLVVTMPAAQMEQLLRAARILLGAAAELGAPVIATEQYPRGLGPTIAPIREHLDVLGITPIEKLAFSGCNEPAFLDALKQTHADAAVVIGMETHICVFQTVRDLVARGLRVDVPIDGVASRRDDHRDVGLDLCKRAGAVATTAETVLFDWMVQSGTDTFKKLSRLVR